MAFEEGRMSDSPNLPLTTGIIAAFVVRNRIAASELPDVIRAVHQALAGLEPPDAPGTPETQKPTAAQIRKSITPGALISFEDGRPYRVLKRHLTTRGLTPAQYRAKWGLPADYPMTAADYAQRRRDVAKAIGLGKRRTREA
jgi:predicted transcriptional regulator